MKHVMLDLETYGSGAGCKIMSIGAVRFDPVGMTLGKTFHLIVNENSQENLRKDESTMQWWDKQDTKAKLTKTMSESDQGVALLDALRQFSAFVKEVPGSFVWANGASFDIPILAYAYREAGMDLPWMFWNDRCYRTIKGLAPEIKINRDNGVYHNALDDAKNQALHLLTIVHTKGLVLK